MDKIIRQAPNGETISFEPNTSEEYIAKYLAQPQYHKARQKRGMLKDIGVGCCRWCQRWCSVYNRSSRRIR